VRFGIRQRLVFVIFFGLFVTMSLIGTYRYFMEKRALLAGTQSHGEETCKLMSALATPLLLTSDFGGLNFMAQNFIHTPDAQEVTITDAGGRQLVRAARPSLIEQRIVVGPFPILSDQTKLGEIRIAVYPAGLAGRLKAFAVSALLEQLFIFFILAVILSASVSKTITGPVQELGTALKDVIDRKDFTRRVAAGRNDEIGALAAGVNYLIERIEQFIIDMAGIATRINDLSTRIASDTREIRQNAELEATTATTVTTSVEKMSSSTLEVAESAESLATSAEETSSAILEMNTSNTEVARHTAELTNSVEDVTTSVTEMIAAIREVAGHVEALSSAAEETAASATQIDASVREVERAAQESAKLSQLVSNEARDSGVTSIREITGAVDRIKESVSRYSDLMTRLGSRSQEIGKILGVIVEVTERTNLLALNASILAAQAGEHGKGFSVVAEEIKALADRTAGSAQDIAKLIASVQKETREAVEAMNDSLAAVDEGVSRSKAAGEALDKILVSSGRSADTANMIERAMTEQSRGIKQVSEAVANVKQMMQQIASATQAQSKGTEMILHASEGMRDIARRVRIAMTEQGRGGKQIAEAAENVTARAEKIAAGTWEQRQISSQIVESMVRIQDLPRQNVKRMEGLTTAVQTLGEQAELLNAELVTMTARKSPAGAGKDA